MYEDVDVYINESHLHILCMHLQERVNTNAMDYWFVMCITWMYALFRSANACNGKDLRRQFSARTKISVKYDFDGIDETYYSIISP